MCDSRYLSREVLLEFVETYRKHQALWKVKSPAYKNKYLKDLGYRDLIAVTKKFEPKADRDFVSKKIQSLRASFRKEHKKVEMSKINALCEDDIYLPSLWYYDHLKFTVEDDAPSVTTWTMDSPRSNTDDGKMEESDVLENQDEERTFVSQDSNQDSGLDPDKLTFLYETVKNKCNDNSKRRRREEKQTFIKACSAALSKNSPSEIGEFDAVGIVVAAKLKRMDTEQQMYADFLIQDILTRGLLGKLTKETSISEKVD